MRMVRREQEDIVLHLEVTKGDRKTLLSLQGSLSLINVTLLPGRGIADMSSFPPLKEEGTRSTVNGDAEMNYLLKEAGTYANEKFEAGIDIQQLKWTTTHTAFRLTFEIYLNLMPQNSETLQQTDTPARRCSERY